VKKSKIKMEFSIKKKEELKNLSYEELLEYVENLTDNIVQEKPRKHSNNSSIPPSQDPNRKKKKKKNQSLRPKSDRKPGGQPGHVGVTLRQSDQPDETVRIPFTLDRCQQCGSDLDATLAVLKEKRQVLDLDLQNIQAQIREYQSFAKVCPVCGHANHDNAFPHDVAPHISYGINLQALVSYLNVSHYLSYGRIVQLLSTLFGIHLSEGTVDNLLKRASQAAEGEIARIKERLALSKVIGIDETGCNINAERHWNWVFQNGEDTLIVVDKSRGRKVINETFDAGFVDACVVHDNYASYSGLVAQEEQLCLAHKLRDLNYAIECDDTQVMKDIKQLLKEAMNDHKETMSPAGHRFLLKQQYEATLDHLLAQPVIPGSETHKQINSFTKARNKIFTFLLHPNIPPDNNGSEQAIRNVKVKLNVSGQFKSRQGAEDYARLRSIIDTSRKRGVNEFGALVKVVKGENVF